MVRQWIKWPLLAVLLLTDNLMAAEGWRVLVLPVADNTPRAGLIDGAVAHIDATLDAKLIELGFDVYDKRLMPLPGCTQQGCRGLSDKQLQALAKKVPQDINLMVLFSLAAAPQSATPKAPWRLQVSGTVVELAGGRQIAAWQGAAREVAAPVAECQGQCLSLWLAQQSQPLAADLGTVLADKLTHYQRTIDYRIDVRDFPPAESVALENYLRSIDGYVPGGFTLLHDNGQRRHWLHRIVTKEFRYRSALASGHLAQTLEAVLRHNDVAATLTYDSARQQFIINRQGLPYARSYLLAGLATLAVVIWLISRLVYRRWQQRLEGYADGRQLARGVAAFESMPLKLLPATHAWRSLSGQWQQQLSRADELWRQAQTAARQGDYVNARCHLETLATLQADRSDATQLLADLDTWQGRIADSLSTAEEACQQQRCYAGLAAVDHLQYQLANELPATETLLPLGQQTSATLATLRQRLLTDCLPLRGNVAGTGALAAWQFFVGDTLEVGRAAEGCCGLDIGYQRLSRLGGQCRLRRERDDFFVTELNSSNGAWFDNSPLVADQSEILANTAGLLSMGGSREPPNPGLCQLRLHRPAAGEGSLVIVPDEEVFSLYVAREVRGWPELASDLRRRWAMIGDRLPIGLDESGGLDIGCLSGARALGFLGYDDGLWLSPATPGESALTVDGSPCWGPVPITRHCLLGLGTLQGGVTPAVNALGPAKQRDVDEEHR